MGWLVGWRMEEIPRCVVFLLLSTLCGSSRNPSRWMLSYGDQLLYQLIALREAFLSTMVSFILESNLVARFRLYSYLSRSDSRRFPVFSCSLLTRTCISGRRLLFVQAICYLLFDKPDDRDDLPQCDYSGAYASMVSLNGLRGDCTWINMSHYTLLNRVYPYLSHPCHPMNVIFLLH